MVVPRGHSVRQLVHHVPVYDRVEILPKHVEEEPVADFAPPDDRLDGLATHQPKPQPQQVDPRPRREYDNDLQQEEKNFYS